MSDQITTSNRLTPELITYLNDIKVPRDDLTRYLYYAYYHPSPLRTGHKFITIGTPIQGLIAIHREQINHNYYLRLRVLHSNDPANIDLLLQELIRFYQASASHGILTTMIPSSRPHPQLAANFQLTTRNFITTTQNLRTKVSGHSSLTAIRYTTKTTSLKQVFSKLLTEHDFVVNSSYNATYHKKVHPTNLRNSKVQQVKMSYFTDSVARDHQWYALILFYQDQPVGFIKTQLSRKIPYAPVDLYLPSKLSKHIPTAYHLLLTSLPSMITHIGRTVIEADSDDRKLTLQLFGNPSAFQYHYF